MMQMYRDEVFAAIDGDHELERIAGGNESEVYRTDDGYHVVKLKHELASETPAAVRWALRLRRAAERYAACLGPRHSITSHYIVAAGSGGAAQPIVLQPFLRGAKPLSAVDYGALSATERASIAEQLSEIIGCSERLFQESGSMPDLYGRTSSSSSERARLNRPHMLPWRMWSFIVRRNLLRSHNLMLTEGPDPRVVLINYDLVRKGWLYRRIYYAVRMLLFWRDRALIFWMKRGGEVPEGG